MRTNTGPCDGDWRMRGAHCQPRQPRAHEQTNDDSRFDVVFLFVLQNLQWGLRSTLSYRALRSTWTQCKRKQQHYIYIYILVYTTVAMFMANYLQYQNILSFAYLVPLWPLPFSCPILSFAYLVPLWPLPFSCPIFSLTFSLLSYSRLPPLHQWPTKSTSQHKFCHRDEYNYLLLSVARQPLVVQDLLITESSRWYSMTRTLGRIPLDVWSARRIEPLYDNMQQSQERYPCPRRDSN